jgi:hypothetical protein
VKIASILKCVLKGQECTLAGISKQKLKGADVI